jgi:hypothetical protein
MVRPTVAVGEEVVAGYQPSALAEPELGAESGELDHEWPLHSGHESSHARVVAQHQGEGDHDPYRESASYQAHKPALAHSQDLRVSILVLLRSESCRAAAHYPACRMEKESEQAGAGPRCDGRFAAGRPDAADAKGLLPHQIPN